MKKMSRLDVVIFGATGFTGKRTVMHMVEFAQKYHIDSWGIAGRSEPKLASLLEELAKKTGADVSSVKIIKADVGDDKSLVDMCAQTKVLVNCAGPYREYGEPVVKAAISSKTDYLDISGEPHFIEKMQLLYDEAAREAGIYIISGCGFDSIPADMGVVFLQKNFSGTVNSIRSYLSVHVPPEIMEKSEGRGVINYGTWESLVYGIASTSELPPLRKVLYPEPLPKLTPKLCPKAIHKKEGADEYYLPFKGLDESVVYRTQRFRHEQERERPIQFNAYFKSGSFWTSIKLIFKMVFLSLMAKMPCSRNSLLNHPKYYTDGYVTKSGPTDIVMNNTFFTFDLIGEGWENGADIENTKPNKKVVAKVTGVNPAYGATCVALLSCATTIIQERQQLPGSGGVLTTGAAFQNTNLIKKLVENNLNYEIIDTQNI